ncbi:oligosaccharide flippase family protein [Niveispirillum lacus]|nr:oligosaccharide flippase family protein [Niveispirillum lacus]
MRAVPALFAIQGLHYLIPLLTIPFLMRVLGLDRWGQVALLITFGQLALILLDYGLHISATQAAARRLGDARGLAALVGAVTLAKLLVAAAGLPLILMAAGLIDHVGEDRSLLVWALAATLVQAHDPLWYFLATNQANKIAGLTVAARLAAVGVMLITIRGPDDAWIYFASQLAAWLMVSVISFGFIQRQTGLSWRDLRGGRALLYEGRSIFQLYAGSSSFDYLVPLVLGVVAGPTSVGLFVGAEKLARAAASLLTPFRNALFPQMSRLLTDAHDEAASLLRWALLRVGGLAAAGSLVLLLAAAPLVSLLLGEAARPATQILQILSLLPLLVTLNGLIGVQWMIPAGRAVALRNIYIAAGFLRLLLCILLAGTFDATGAALATILGELSVLVACLLYLRRWPVQARAG